MSGPFSSEANATAGVSPAPLPGPAAVAPTPTQQRSIAEIDLLDLLTGALQRDYVKEKGQLELRLMLPWKTRSVPEGATLKVLEVPNAGVTASFVVRFELLADGKSLGTSQMPVTAKVWREVWVARSGLKRGELVSEADIARERRDILSVRDTLADFAEGDANLQLAEPLQAGSPLLARSVKPRTLVRRGQTAEARFESGSLSVSMKVEILEDGIAGQVVRARNPVSLRNIRGKVMNDQTILISM